MVVISNGCWSAIDLNDPTLIRLQVAGQYIHQGGFAGTVFSADGVDFAGVDIEGYFGEGFYTGEGFGYLE